MRPHRISIILPLVALIGAATTSSRPQAQAAAPSKAAAPTHAAAQASTPAPTPANTAAPAKTPASATARADHFEKTVKPFVETYCADCHNEKRKKGGLNLLSYETRDAMLGDITQWEQVVRKLRGNEMPPEEEPQPEAAEKTAVTRWVAREIERHERTLGLDPGRVTTRRLNRTEYNNSVRELLGVHLRPADDFPQDDTGYGFDNIGDVLSLSPILMERYVAAADRVVRTAIYGVEPMKPTLVRINAGPRTVPSLKAPLFEYDRTGLGLPNALHGTHQFPVDAEYVLRASLGGVRPAGSEPLPVTLWLDGQEVQATTLDPDGGASFFLASDRQDFSGKMVEFRVRVTAGQHQIAIAIPRLYEGLPAKYAGPNPSKRPPPPPEVFNPPANATPERLARMKANFEARQKEIVPVSEPRVGHVEITGPYEQRLGPSAESLSRIYTCGHVPRDGQPAVHQSFCATKIVSSFARRAFRRPVAASELDRYLALVDMARKEGDTFEEGIGLALQGILVSPDFLFRIERDRPATVNAAATAPVSGKRAGTLMASHAPAAHPISQHELATRLSYFLWSGPPDAELMRHATRRTLRNPTVLAAQVRRMLKDPRSRALAEEFGGQWLQFRALESMTRDKDKFPEFEDYLRISMRRETELFFEHIIREDRSILDFLDGRYTFLNERLAKHYGIPNITGPEFRRVDLSTTNRGGVLTHASVLSVSSYATRTSPVLRGKWILDNILGAPPPDPPPDVPNLDENAVGSSASMRQQMEAHRKNPTCASCHKRMDPLGFGLENFDATGAWRTEDGKFPIDASGSLPDGRDFNGPDELRAILKGDREEFTQCLTGKLLTYALGRGLEPFDRHAVKTISKRVAAQQYRFSTLVIEIVNSRPFQMRRAAPVSGVTAP